MTKKEESNKKVKSLIKESGDELSVHYEDIVEGLMQGKGLFGEGGLLKPLISKFVEAALDAEMKVHLNEEAASDGAKGNKRNGRQTKKIRTESGEVSIEYS